MKSILFGAFASALLLAGCDSLNQREVTQGAEVSATVTSVDPKTREINLQTQQGEAVTLTATPEMRNFDQIKPGDTAVLQMFGSVAVRVADGTTPEGRETFALLGRAPEGERPGAVMGQVTTATVRFVGYNPSTFEAEIIGPDGDRMIVPVQPGMRAFAAARTPGERVEVTISDAVAMFVTAPGA